MTKIMTDKEIARALEKCKWDLIEIRKMEKRLKEIDEDIEVKGGEI